MSQSIADGYYRVMNGSGRYATMINKKIDKTNSDAVKTGGGAHIFALRMKDLDKIISDPGSIIQMKYESSGYTLKSQDTDTKTMTSLYLQAVTYVPYEGTNYTPATGSYFLYGSQGGQTRYLFDSDNESETDYENGKVVDYNYLYCAGIQTTGKYTLTNKVSNWYFKPIDNETQYFGITPDVELNGKYYTTVYCGFPFKVTGDMKAYYVTDAKANNNVAKLNLIEDGIVPAATPVIIECTSNDPSVNKTIVGVTASKSYSTSLKGVYYSYAKMNVDGKNENTSSLGNALKNATTYQASRMRMLNVSDGHLALVKPTNAQLHTTNSGANKYIPANKAYLDLSGAKDIILLDDGTLGINSVSQKAKNTAVYNLQGQKVAKEGTSIDELPRGIYIVNGKKVVKD